MEKEMLMKKELEDLIQRQKEDERTRLALQQKFNLQSQMEMKAQLRQEAYQEYMKEKGQVDKVISKMIDEDQKMIALIKMKQEQSKLDMVQSVTEKRDLVRKQKELEVYENEMLRRYSEQQEGRQAEIQEKKASAEAAREEIFQKLKEEEERRRADSEYVENLRNELYMQELEEQARARERADVEKRER